MFMLRNFQYDPNQDQLLEVLQKFKLDFNAQKSPIDVLRFEVLSPDSFMWKLLLGNAIYYLYAEDYVSGIDYIQDEFNDYLGTEKWEFVRPNKVSSFEESEPVKSAEVYEKPERADDLMEYAVSSGYDFVFLVKTLENPDSAHFAKTK